MVTDVLKLHNTGLTDDKNNSFFKLTLNYYNVINFMYYQHLNL